MRINILISFLIFLLFSNIANSYEHSISEKYNDIFSKNVLESSDIENYRIINSLQEKCRWKSANKFIFKLKNKILIGHVFAQRYLHPNCYRSKYLELYYWLKKYNDHPQARKIYRLAIKRMPKGYKSPNKPINPIGVIEERYKVEKKSKYKSLKKLSKNQLKEKKKLINAIKSRVNRGWPTGAVKLLQQRDVKKLLDQVEIDQQKELISKGYFLANKNELAIKYGSEALATSGAKVPYAAWTAGLSAWRLKRYKESAEYFSLFSISL